MKIYIRADIEGVTGVSHGDETELDRADSAVPREQMTAEVTAACEGALQAGRKSLKRVSCGTIAPTVVTRCIAYPACQAELGQRWPNHHS